MKVKIEVELGNDGMQSVGDARVAIVQSLARWAEAHGGNGAELLRGDCGVVMDENGNRVGEWAVDDDDGTAVEQDSYLYRGGVE